MITLVKITKINKSIADMGMGKWVPLHKVGGRGSIYATCPSQQEQHKHLSMEGQEFKPNSLQICPMLL